MSDNLFQHVRSRYLDLLEGSIQNSIYGESQLEMTWRRIVQRLRHPYLTRRGAIPWPSKAHSMIGPRRLRNVRELVERTLSENVPGDYIETGVWRGGACILMRGVLEAYGVRDRRVFCADLFKAFHRPTPGTIQPIGATVYLPSRSLRSRSRPCGRTSPPTACSMNRWFS